jgi:GntR family transcriptional repressor for pyruvate dehydrogenase complex
MANFKKLERKPLSESIAEQIEAAIYDGTFDVGTQLPAEQQLAGQFGVSRNVVREAFKYLKERGLIDIQNGMGAYVSQPTTDITSSALGRYIRMLDRRDIITNLYEVRRLIEGESARLAALQATKDDIDHLNKCLQRMEQHGGSVISWADADLDFHLSLASASGNSLFPVLLQPLVDYLREVIIEGYSEPGAVERGLEAHRKVYQCINARDAEGAHKIILEHLRDSEGRIERMNTRKSVS